MKTQLTTSLFFIAIMFSLNAQAKVWRINNTAGLQADFTSPAAAVASASVLNGDTLHIEASVTNYGGFTLNKRLVLIGPGYFLSGANGNAGLQANNNAANFGSNAILFDSAATGSTLMGLSNFGFQMGGNLGSATDNITITRCHIARIVNWFGPAADTKMVGWKLNKNYIFGDLAENSWVIENWDISNNIIVGAIQLNNSNNLNYIIRNNVLRGNLNISNAYFANNIINNTTINLLSTVVKNNIAIGAPGGFTSYVGTNGNINNQTDAAVFQGLAGNSTDGQWRLKAGSSAIGAGLTVGSVTSPDCGAYGATDPYRLSGIPPVPTIYTLTVPASIPSGSSTMNVIFSTRNNN